MVDILVVYIGHNATVHHFKHGHCIYADHEEKFNGIKNATGFPTRCFEKVLNSIEKGKEVVVATPYSQTFCFDEQIDTTPDRNDSEQYFGWAKQKLNALESSGLFPRKLIERFRDLLMRIYNRRSRLAFEAFVQNSYPDWTFSFDYVNHHAAHNWASVYFFNLKESEDNPLLVSIDGAGDENCSMAFYLNKKNSALTKYAETYYTNSPALLYLQVTKHLGMKANEHEYKVMGLSAYPKDPRYYQEIVDEFKKLIRVNENSLSLQSTVNMNVVSEVLRERLKNKRFDNIAAALQQFLEELTLAYLEILLAKSNKTAIALSGGIFLNVKMNKFLIEHCSAKKMFFLPAPGDETLGFGVGEALSKENKYLKTKKTSGLYLGADASAFSSDEIRSKAGVLGLKVQSCEKPSEEVAQFLVDGKTVAVMNGRGELGPRSLGNRAILARADSFDMFHKVNDAIKQRDFWMPFAPVILEHWAPRYIKRWDLYAEKCLESMKYMIVATDVTELGYKHLKAAVHQGDKSIRPQVLSNADNTNLWDILTQFEGATGIGGILNTSFNLHGSPMVGNVDQALHTYANSALDLLVIGNNLIQKER